MKVKFALFALIALFAFSCSDDEGTYTCSSCSETPDANVAYNATGQGVYKGIVVGSSGTIVFYIANDGSTINAVLEIDNKRVELSVAGGVTYSEANGLTATFTGTLNGSPVSISFTVDNTGSADVTNISIPDHTDVQLFIYKELSNKLVAGFEGSFSGDSRGTFNFVVRYNENGTGVWYAISRTSGDQPETGFFQGELDAEGNAIGSGGDVLVTGAIVGDVVTGVWGNQVVSGTWKGKRTI